MAKRINRCYAIKKGIKCGVIVDTWDECKLLVDGFSGAIFKGFRTFREAEEWLHTKLPKKIIKIKQLDGTIFIPATNKKDKYGQYKPRHYGEDGFHLACHGITIGCNCDVNDLYNGELPPWS